jgi:DNA polymerase
MFVGEQPGNDEDLEGEPFVGPAGRVFDEALRAAGIPRKSSYVTNMVKHFRFERVGKRRLHKRPTVAQTNACKPWLLGELAAVKPRVVVLLGATAAQAMLGRSFQVTRMRGIAVPAPFADVVIATVHPSSVLRQRTSEERRAALAAFTADLRIVARAAGLAAGGSKVPPSALRKTIRKKSTRNKANP